jgi:hypothetical protein
MRDVEVERLAELIREACCLARTIRTGIEGPERCRMVIAKSWNNVAFLRKVLWSVEERAREDVREIGDDEFAYGAVYGHTDDPSWEPQPRIG